MEDDDTLIDWMRCPPFGSPAATPNPVCGARSPPALREVAFDPKSRRLLAIDKPTAEDVKRFKAVMADDVQVRKELLGI